MGFGCQIILKDGTSLTSAFGDDGKIQYQLLGLGANTSEATPSPWRVSHFRDVVACGIDPEETMKELQQMGRDNLNSLIPHPDCPSCECEAIDPEGWSVEKIERLLAIDPDKVKSIKGGY